MPKKEINDYLFYKIVCLDNSFELCYVGSTANWKSRSYNHKYNCNNENSTHYNLKLYTTIRQNGGWDNFKMIEIGKREQLRKREAEQIEEEYRQELKANLNMQKCFTTEEDERAYKKKWGEANKEKIKESSRQWREANKEYSKEYYKANKEYYKEYYQVNKEVIKEINRNYMKNSYDKEKRRQKYLAEKEAKNKK